MTWRGWNIKKCRQLLQLDLGDFQDVVKREHLGCWNESGLVYLVDGSVVNAPKTRRLRFQQQKSANAVKALCEHAENIRSYMNGRRPNRFTQIVAKNLHSARKAVVSGWPSGILNTRGQDKGK